MGMAKREQMEWWRGAAIYHVFPASFQDSNGDGFGDLRGLISRLDYIRSLGVDAIWVTPFFVSPRVDYGYDVADYLAVSPDFGTMADAEELIARAHALGLKVMFDYVLCHTSQDHDWFRQSRQDRTNPKADWFVWADAGADGTPPSNWLSVFGGPAWTFDQQRGQYYLHNFLPEQPALNYRNPEVLDALVAGMRFWLEKGIDGYRLDAIAALLYDNAFRDNPPVSGNMDAPAFASNPFFTQEHRGNRNVPGIDRLLERLRDLADEFPGAVLMGEMGDGDTIRMSAEFTQGHKLHMATNFAFNAEPFPAKDAVAVISRFDKEIGTGWVAHNLSNTEVSRTATRMYLGGDRKALAEMGLGFLTSLKGSILVYYGEELGLPDASVAREFVHDPYGTYFWPDFTGRDPYRLTFPWDAAAPANGFSTGSPWLPLAEDYGALAVATQEADAGSTLHLTRALLAFRKRHRLWTFDQAEVLEAIGEVVLTLRRRGDEIFLSVFNFRPEATEVALPVVPHESDSITRAVELEGRNARIGAYGFALWVGRAG